MSTLERDRRVSFPAALFADDPDVLMANAPVVSADRRDAIDRADWIALIASPRPAINVQRMLRAIRQRTGWSSRAIANALGTSHTTIQRTLRGRPLVAARSAGLERRVADTAAVTRRLYEVAEHDQDRLVQALLRVDPISERSAADLLAEGRSGEAYLIALDFLVEREDGALLVGRRPTSPTGATVPLTE